MKFAEITYRKVFVNYFSFLTFILCCFIPINESYYNNNYNDIYQRNLKLKHNDRNNYETPFFSNNDENGKKSSRALWKEKSPIMTFPPYSRERPTSGIFPQDLISQETMDVSNSIWGNNAYKKEAKDYNNVDMDRNTRSDSRANFEENVHGLVNEWIYNDYDEYENYPNEDTMYQDNNELDSTLRWNRDYSPSYPSKSSSSFLSSPFRDQSMMNANRRADHANRDIENQLGNKYQNHPDHSEHKQDVAKYRKRKGNFDENQQVDKNNNGFKNVEGKQIISGVDINPLTSNALMGFTNPSSSLFPSSSESLKDLYNTNDIFSGLQLQSNRMKKGFDKAIRGVGDSTIGVNNKEAFKKDVNHFVTGFTNTMNEIDDNSINSKFRNKFKFGGNSKDSVMSSMVKNERTKSTFNDNNREVEKKTKHKKLPQIIQRVKNNIKGMGNYVLKKTKQMLVEPPKTSISGLAKSNFPLATKDGGIDRQGGIIASFGSLLSSVVGGPAMTWVSVVSLVVVEVVSMGLQSAFQINQSTPTSAPPKPTETTTKGI